jgi:hypothetical protein
MVTSHQMVDIYIRNPAELLDISIHHTKNNDASHRHYPLGYYDFIKSRNALCVTGPSTTKLRAKPLP